jgi:hypothetical protein
LRSASAFLAALALLPAACGGGGGSAQEVLAETATKLGDIRSGTMSFRYVASSAGGAEAGVELEGPFGFESGRPLPVAELEITQFAGSRRGSTTFISTGEKAFLRVGGETFELPPEMLAEAEGGTEAGALGELRIEDWFLEPELSDGGEVGGAATDRIRSRLDVVSALNDFLAAAEALGGLDLGALEGPSAQNLENAVRSATVDVYTGKDDRLLRRLSIEVELELAGSGELREALGDLAGARLRLDLRISDPNEPVSVQEPEDAVPYPGPSG